MIAANGWDDFPDLVPRSFLADGGEMGDAVRAFDWSKIPLGPMEDWPLSLKTITRLVLTSKQPMCFFWGPKLLNFFNDSFRPMLGKRAERALGMPFKEIMAGSLG